jgi:hypothetical protein
MAQTINFLRIPENIFLPLFVEFDLIGAAPTLPCEAPCCGLNPRPSNSKAHAKAKPLFPNRSHKPDVSIMKHMKFHY